MTELLTTSEAAGRLKVTPRMLEARRSRGGGPPFVKVGRAVRYREADLEAWIAERTRASTSDPGES